ncbi:hypothetical protein [Bradyrhizobium sp. 150]|uniref:hypothetical protein n=1 Tax=Bradyrhizobium sp. 150 TaxID=2782625 RepID=UPI001FFB7A91|nr:hypothetical protein [Bradyrhizobium sp. 150]MCK1676591.1 hypothetical protein [Bradyrhizobium sp. 150]
MTLSVAELQLLLEALDMAISRSQSQADYYEARPDRYTTASVTNIKVNPTRCKPSPAEVRVFARVATSWRSHDQASSPAQGK